MTVLVGADKCKKVSVLSKTKADCSTPGGKAGKRKVAVVTKSGRPKGAGG